MNSPICMPLREPGQAWTAFQSAWKEVNGWLTGGGGPLELEVRKATRSSKQNRLLHAMLRDIALQKEWAGARRDAEVWKRLMTASWCRAKGEHVEILPALDGHGVDIVFRRTSQLTRAECADLCDFIAAWCADQGVELQEAAQWTDVDPQTGEIYQPKE